MYLSAEQCPEVCRDRHHTDPRTPHGDLPCEECPVCGHPIKETYVSIHRKLHEQEHPYHEPPHH